MNKIHQFTRNLTAPHIFALILLVLLYVLRPSYIGNVWFLLAGITFLTVLPILAYPMQKFIPRYKDRGREGQRKLAVIFSFVGYLLGTVTVFLLGAPVELKMVFTEYLLCGICIFIADKVFKYKASGHACGSTGPMAMLVYMGLYIPAAICAAFIVPVCVSSIKTKRHTPLQLVVGSIIPIAMLVIVHFTFKVL